MILNKDEVIGRRNTPHRARTAEYLARDLLRSRGYTVLRSIDADVLVNLVAWSPAGAPPHDPGGEHPPGALRRSPGRHPVARRDQGAPCAPAACRRVGAALDLGRPERLAHLPGPPGGIVEVDP